jgi:beta-N-acetylhexosaminidase
MAVGLNRNSLTWLAGLLLAIVGGPAFASEPLEEPANTARAEITTQLSRTLMVGFRGSQADDKRVDTLLAVTRGLPVGGFILFDRNIRNEQQVTKLIDRLEQAVPEHQFIAVDEEGGIVRRLNRLSSVPTTPPARTVGGLPIDRAFRTYDRLAASLAKLGFNLNLGPVVDLDLPGENPVIGKLGRSYGSDPVTVARYASAFIGAHRLHDIDTTIKHFPGHGSSREDPHDRPVDVAASWTQVELEPFERVIESDPPGFAMTSHLALRSSLFGQKQSEVTTFSPGVVSYLRDTLNFRGIVISDDLTMGAITSEMSLEDAVAKALLAGHDMVILARLGDDPAGRLRRLIDSVAASAANDPQLARSIRNASDRVKSYKENRFAHATDRPGPLLWQSRISHAERGLRLMTPIDETSITGSVE